MSENTNKQKIFADGITVQPPLEKNKDWHVVRIGFNVVKFFRWMQDHQNEKGWVDMDIKISPKGPWYGELNNFKPTPRTDQPSENTETAQNLDDIPF